MQRDIESLRNSTFDIVIVGAGIHGAVLAAEATHCGYRVALLDKGDFGSATSANSLKIIHGGIRHLQHGHIKGMRESIRSRRAMMQFAPHLVRPLECLIPTYGHGLRGREMMRLAFGLYDAIAADRNKGLPATSQLPRSRSVSVDEVTLEVPHIASPGLTGGMVWYDAIADNTERLILEYVKEAQRCGAVVANYVEAIGLATSDGKINSVRGRDRLSGEELQLSCRMAVNTSGPWLQELVTGLESLKWAPAVNLVVKKRLFRKYAVGLEGHTDYQDRDAFVKRGKRLFFFVPWLDKYTMIGTIYRPYVGTPGDFTLGRADIEEMVAEINRIYPHGKLTLADVSFFHAGLLPISEADRTQPDSARLDKSSEIIDHSSIGGPSGLLSIKGVKYTTAPDMAEKVLKIVGKPQFLGRKKNSGHRSEPAKQIDFDHTISLLGERFAGIRTHLDRRYGGGWRDVFALLVQECGGKVELLADELIWLVNIPRLLKAELLYFIRNEMAVKLADVVFRRSDVASAECPDDFVLQRIAECMGKELGWSGEECGRQVAEVKRVFAPLAP